MSYPPPPPPPPGPPPDPGTPSWPPPTPPTQPYPNQPYPLYTPVGPTVPTTNNLAIASLSCSIGGAALGFCCGIFALAAVVGIVLGFVARAQINQSGGTQTGEGLALAGIIVGFCAAGLWALMTILYTGLIFVGS